MLRSDSFDFSDAYIVVKGKFAVNFSYRKNYGVNDFPDELFPDNIFPDGISAAQRNTAKTAAKTDVVNNGNNNDIRTLIKVISSRNNAPFISCISKINGALINNAEDLDVVMLVYNLIEYSKNYSKTLGSLWNYYRDEPTYDKKKKHYLKSNSFDYKSSVISKLGDIDNENNTNKENFEIAVLLKHLSNVGRKLFNCEVTLTLI